MSGPTEANGRANDLPPVIINTVICFIQNKMLMLPSGTIIKLCADHFSSEEIEVAKNKLFTACPSETARMISRKGMKKDISNIEDILKRLNELDPAHAANPMFVTHDLNSLPSITFDYCDVSTLVTKIENMYKDIHLLKSGMEMQLENVAELTAKTALCDPTNGPVQRKVLVLDDPDGEEENELIKESNTSICVVPQSVNVQSTSAALQMTLACKNATRRTRRGDLNSSYDPTRTNQNKFPESVTYEKDEEEDGWQTIMRVNGKRKEVKLKNYSNSGIIGSGKSVVTLKTVQKQKFASVFVSRIDPANSAECVKTYLKNKLTLDVNVQEVKAKYDTYKSFHVTCACDDPLVFMNSDTWPDGTFVKWWRRDQNKMKSTTKLNSENNQL